MRATSPPSSLRRSTLQLSPAANTPLLRHCAPAAACARPLPLLPPRPPLPRARGPVGWRLCPTAGRWAEAEAAAAGLRRRSGQPARRAGSGECREAVAVRRGVGLTVSGGPGPDGKAEAGPSRRAAAAATPAGARGGCACPVRGAAFS